MADSFRLSDDPESRALPSNGKRLPLFSPLHRYPTTMPPLVRPFLAVAQTLVSPATASVPSQIAATQPIPAVPFWGSTMAVSADAREWVRRQAPVRLLHLRALHQMPPRRGGAVDPVRYPLAMLNEPPPHRSATASGQISSSTGAIPQLPAKTPIDAIGVFVRGHRGGGEILVHYGVGTTGALRQSGQPASP